MATPETFKPLPEVSAAAIDKLLDVGAARAALINPGGGMPAILVPAGYKLEMLDDYVPEPAPTFIKESVALTTAESFVAYVQRFALPETVLFAKVTDTECKVVAVIDYHDGPAQAARRAVHLAVFSCTPTREFKEWMASDRKPMTQEQFAVFIQANERLIHDPKGSEFLELVTNLEGKCNVAFTSGLRLASGKNSLRYEEDVDLRGSQGTGVIEIPQVFTLGLQPFEGGAFYDVKARLRYRIESRKLSFWYETITPHLIVRDAAQAALALIGEGLPGRPIFQGTRNGTGF
jgi:uncharacterized protein YfdQ (DUF2303 family)